MAKKKTSKIDNAISELDEIKKKQVLAEIRSIKIQYTIAILSLVGSAIAFIVVQRNDILELTKRNPRLSIMCDDAFVKRSARLTITESGKKESFLEADIKNIEGEIELPAGSYQMSIVLGNQPIWNESYILQPNQSRLIKLPEFFQNRISLYVKNHDQEAKPKSKLNLDINSSGNGYLWIYELIDEKIELLFPATTEVELNVHEISASQPFTFPEGVYLAAGQVEKQEKYIFLVTSLNDVNFSQEIVNNIYGKDIDKGEIMSIEKNWGIASIDVTVKK